MDPTSVRDLAEFAETGVRAGAKELDVDLKALNVELSEFMFHLTDSPPRLYTEAANSAFRAAWDAWRRLYNLGRRKDH